MTTPIQDILKKSHHNGFTVPTVNSRDKYIETVDGKSVSERIEALLKKEKISPEGVAKLLSELLDDNKSKPYYLILAKEHNQGRLLEAAHITKDAYQRGLIRTTRPIYFQAILRNWGFRTKFKK